MLLFCVTKKKNSPKFWFFFLGRIFHLHEIFVGTIKSKRQSLEKKCVYTVYKVNHNTNQSEVIKFMAIFYTAVLVVLTFTHMNLPHYIAWRYGKRNQTQQIKDTQKPIWGRESQRESVRNTHTHTQRHINLSQINNDPKLYRILITLNLND